MKIKQSHYQYMLDTIRETIDSKRDTMQAHIQTIKSDHRVKDVNRRFRWDLTYAAKLSPWICDNLYSYMDDSHIDTALRHIVKDLNLSV